MMLSAITLNETNYYYKKKVTDYYAKIISFYGVRNEKK